MSFNGSGTFLRLFRWATDAANSVNPNAGRFDQEDDGFAAGLSNCITKDGQTQPTADIPMNGKKLVNLGTATATTDALNLATADARYPTAASKGVANGIASLDGTALVPDAQIPGLDASKIATGTIAAARIPTLAFSQISGSVSNAQVPQAAVQQFQGVLSIAATQITSGGTIPTTAVPFAQIATRNIQGNVNKNGVNKYFTAIQTPSGGSDGDIWLMY